MYELCPIRVYVPSMYISPPYIGCFMYISPPYGCHSRVYAPPYICPIRVYVIRCSKCISPLYGCHFRVRTPLCIGPSMHISLCFFVCLFFDMYFPSACMSFPYVHSTECMFPFRVSHLIGSQETKPLHSPR